MKKYTGNVVNCKSEKKTDGKYGGTCGKMLVQRLNMTKECFHENHFCRISTFDLKWTKFYCVLFSNCL